MKGMQEGIVGLWAWLKSKYTVIQEQERSDPALAAGRGA